MPRRFFARHQPDMSLAYGLKAAFGAALALLVALALGGMTEAVMIFPSMGASAMLIFGAPENPFSQPAHVVAGHVIAAASALAANQLFPAGGPLVIAGAIAAVMLILGLLRLSHPPAGATVLVVLLTHPDWKFLLTPVFTGAITLVLVALVVHRLPPRMTYPLPPRETP